MMAAPAQANVQVLFNKPEGMQVRWDVTGVAQFDSTPVVVPARQNFSQGGIFQMKITSIPDRAGVELYPTLEIGPGSSKTAAYLAHNAIPIQFTPEDFDQVMTGNFVTKVIYLPDPEFQDLAIAGVETLVSTRLDPGMDPIVEADRRGTIMAIIRLGNKDKEMPGAVGAGVMPARYTQNGQQGGVPTPAGPIVGGGGAPYRMAPSGLVQPYISGVTGPAYGMPYSATQIGLPGPPHLPFGAPAGLQRTRMINRTPMRMPAPTRDLTYHLRSTPGYSYPRQPRHVSVREQSFHPSPIHAQPFRNMNQTIRH